MAKTVLAVGAHYGDCVFGIPGILLQAARRRHRIVLLCLVGDYTNWAPVRGRQAEFVRQTAAVSREYGAETRYLAYASHRFDVTPETKRAVAEVVADVRPDVGFLPWPRDRHHDHEVAGTLAKIAFQHGDRLLDGAPFRAVPAVYAYDNGPRHTVGFEPNTFVDTTPEWETALEWLGRFMALRHGRPYDPATRDPAQEAKAALAGYRGLSCGTRYAEALWALTPSPQDVV